MPGENLENIERIGSPMVQVYYDVGNSARNHYNVAGEIRVLGRERICEIHIKDTKTLVLGSSGGGVDFAAVAAACRDIGYDQWYVLETSGRESRFEEDTRTSVAFVQSIFA